MNLNNRIITMEHLNHLPLRKRIPKALSGDDDEAPEVTTDGRKLSWNSEYPLPGREFKGEITSAMLKLMKQRFKDYSSEYPIRLNRIIAYQKYHIRWRLQVGSIYSQASFNMTRRDDSYIIWRCKDTPNSPANYGRVVIFLHIYTWQPVVIIQPIRQVERSIVQAVKLIQDEGPMMSILLEEILGPAGTISRQVKNEVVTYLVSEIFECKFPELWATLSKAFR